MLLTEYNELKTMEAFRRDGFEDGKNMLAKLMDILFSLNRISDAKKAASDEKARKEFYREFGMID